MRWEGDKGGRAPCASTWTAEKDAALRRLWPRSDLNCPQIAIAIGDGATKNAVIGRARRLGLGPRSSEAKQRGQLADAATKRAKPERQRVVSVQALADRRELQAAIGRAVVAKREPRRFADTDGLVKELKQRQKAEQKAARPWRDKLHDLSPQSLTERREKQAAAGRAAIAKVELRLIDNQAFVAKAEKPADLYAHMRTERGYHDAIAALLR